MRAASAAGIAHQRFGAATADAGRAAIASAAARARARSSARGQTAFAMPQATAVAASTASPSTNIENARAWPMRAGSVRLDAASGTSARFTNGVVSSASSDDEHQVAVQQHGRADADGAAVDRRHDRRGGSRERGQQRIAAGARRIRRLAAVDRREVAEIVAGGEHVAFRLDQDAADVRFAAAPSIASPSA